MKCQWEKLTAILPPEIARQLDGRDRENAREIRLRLGAAPEINLGTGRRVLCGQVSQENLTYAINLASKYSPWCAATLAQGYLTAPGGHRIGVCGDGIFRQGQTDGFRSVRSLCIRVARDFPGIGTGLDGKGLDPDRRCARPGEDHLTAGFVPADQQAGNGQRGGRAGRAVPPGL